MVEFGQKNRSAQSSFLGAFAWNHAGRLLEYALMYLFSLIVARGFGPELYGTYAFFLSTVQLLLVISSFGMETALASFVPRFLKDSSKEVLGRTLRYLLLARIFFGVLLGMVLYMFRDTLANIFHAPAVFIELLFFLIFYFLCRSIVSLFASFQIARFETQPVGVTAFGVRLVEVLGVVILLNLGLGFRALWFLVAGTNLLQVLALGFSLRDCFSMVSSSSEVKNVLATGTKFWLNSIVEFVLGRQADILLLGYFLVGTLSIGYYDVALGFAQMINFGMAGGLYGLSVASFSSLAAAGKERLTRHFEFLSSAIVVAIIPMFVFAAAFASTILPLFYSSSYSSSIVLFQSISVFFMLTRFLGGGIAADYLQAMRRTNALFVGSGVGGAVNLTLAILLIPRYGTIGAVFATGIAAIVIASVHALFVQREMNVRFPVALASWISLISIVSTILANEFSSGMGSENLFLKFLLFVFFFAVGSIVVRPIPSEFADYCEKLHPSLARLLKPFVALPMRETIESLVPPLTDRQKWAFAWLPVSNVIADIGSSATPLCWYLRGKSNLAVVIDKDRQSLEELTSLQVDVVAINAAAEHIPLANESVDTVLLLDVLEHVNNEQRVIDEVWRILRPDGTLILSVPHKGLFRWLDPQNLSARLRRTSRQNHHHHYSESELRELFIQKFRITRRRFGGLFLYPLAFAGENFFKKYFRVNLSRFFKKAADIDNDFSWGTMSYNILLQARKLSSGKEC